MSFAPRFSITNEIASSLTRIERARGFLEAATLSEHWVSSMRSRAFLLEAHHTTHIEGTRLTLDDAARLLEGAEVPAADPDDTRELLNYRRAFDFVSSYLNEGAPTRGCWYCRGARTATSTVHACRASDLAPFLRHILRHSCAGP